MHGRRITRDQFADAALMVGTAARAIEAAAAWSCERQQFGQPIGRFQVLQHRMADMFLEVEQIVSMTLMATLKLDLPADERKAAVSLAKAKVSRSAKFVGQSAIQTHGEAVFGEPIPESGTPLYTDVRLYGARGVPAVIYGAGPRTVLESNAKRADEHLLLADLQRATRVVARAMLDLLTSENA